MSYLSNPASTSEFGLVTVGSNINVLDGLISIAQNVSPNANITFASANITGNLTAGGNLVVTNVVPSVGNGLALTNVVSGGTTASFTVTNTGVLNLSAGNGVSVSNSTGNVTVTNTGVLSLTAGSGISLTANTGHVTISSYGADLINVIGVTANYSPTITDEYIGVYSATAITISLPTGIPGRVYYIKDEYGQGSGKITIQPVSGELVDGKPNYVISVPYQSVGLVFRGTSWWII